MPGPHPRSFDGPTPAGVSSCARRCPVLLALVASGCASTQIAPLHVDFTPADLEPDERVLWSDATELEARIGGSELLYPDAAVNAYLEQVTLRLLESNPSAAHHGVRPHVIADPAPNAFVLANGALYVTTGLMARLENEAQLATVIGHEIAHVVSRDTVRGRRAAERARRGAAAINALLLGFAASRSESWRLSHIGGYSRAQEFAADAQGLNRMIEAGYDPKDAGRLFDRMRADRRDVSDALAGGHASHPELAERAARYRAWLATDRGKRALATGGALNTEEYEDAVATLLLDHAEMAIEQRHTVAAARAVDRYLERHPASARAWFLRGETARRGDPASLDVALRAYRHAAGLPEPPAGVFKALGLIHRQKGEHDLAAASLQTYLQLEPDALDAPIIRGLIEEAERG